MGKLNESVVKGIESVERTDVHLFVGISELNSIGSFLSKNLFLRITLTTFSNCTLVSCLP